MITVSTQQKLAKIFGLIDTKDVSEWENNFLKSLHLQAQFESNKMVARLSDRQLAVVERLHDKHFA